MHQLRIVFLAVVAGIAIAVLGCGDEESNTDVAGAVQEQLRYLDKGSSLVVAVDLRYGKRNWDHVRALATRGLRGYRENVDAEERIAVPPNLSGALNQLAGFAGLSFDKDVQPLLDGYLVIGLTVPARRPAPKGFPSSEELRRLMASEPRTTIVYRTRSRGLRKVLEKVQDDDPLEPLRGRDGVSLIEPNMALVGDDTLVYAIGGEEGVSSGKASPRLQEALDRAESETGFPAGRLRAAQSSAGFADPLALAVGELTLSRLLLEETNFRRALRQVQYLRAVRGLVGAIAIDGDGLRGVARVETRARELKEGDLPLGQKGKLEMPERDDAVVGASRDQSATTAFATKVARTLFAGSRFVRAVEATERSLGINFEKEFLRQFDCPSVSVLESQRRRQRFAARSCVRDPGRMRKLLPRLAPHLPRILSGLRSLDNEGLVTLLLVAPDAPLTPSALGALASIAIRPLSGLGASDGEKGKDEQLYQLEGLRDPARSLGLTGADRVVFGMVGDHFVVASDRKSARNASRLKTRSISGQAASAIRVSAAFFARTDEVQTKIVSRLFENLLITFSGNRSAITARAELGFSR